MSETREQQRAEQSIKIRLAALATAITTATKATPQLHQPERGENETFAEYKARRAASNKANRDAQRNPNHGLTGSRQQFRNSMRASGAMGKRIRASDALMAAWASKRVTKTALRDEHGALTLVGKPYELVNVHPTTREFVLSGGVDGDDFFYTVQRKWLAGVSAQRGF